MQSESESWNKLQLSWYVHVNILDNNAQWMMELVSCSIAPWRQPHWHSMDDDQIHSPLLLSPKFLKLWPILTSFMFLPCFFLFLVLSRVSKCFYFDLFFLLETCVFFVMSPISSVFLLTLLPKIQSIFPLEVYWLPILIWRSNLIYRP